MHVLLGILPKITLGFQNGTTDIMKPSKYSTNSHIWTDKPIKSLLLVQVYEDESWRCTARSARCWARLLCRLRPHLCVLVCPAAVVIDWSSFSHRGQLWMRCLPDSCAGTDCDPCCQVTEPFYPRHSLSTAQCLPSASSLSCSNDKTHVRL